MVNVQALMFVLVILDGQEIIVKHQYVPMDVVQMEFVQPQTHVLVMMVGWVVIVHFLFAQINAVLMENVCLLLFVLVLLVGLEMIVVWQFVLVDVYKEVVHLQIRVLVKKDGKVQTVQFLHVLEILRIQHVMVLHMVNV